MFSEDSVCKPCSLLKGQSSQSKYSLKKKEKTKRKKRKEVSEESGSLYHAYLFSYVVTEGERHRNLMYIITFFILPLLYALFYVYVCHVLSVVIWNINSTGTKVHRSVALDCSEAFWSRKWPWVIDCPDPLEKMLRLIIPHLCSQFKDGLLSVGIIGQLEIFWIFSTNLSINTYDLKSLWIL